MNIIPSRPGRSPLPAKVASGLLLCVASSSGLLAFHVPAAGAIGRDPRSSAPSAAGHDPRCLVLSAAGQNIEICPP